MHTATKLTMGLLLLCVLLLRVPESRAAELMLDTIGETANKNELTIQIRIAPENDVINAIESEILFDETLLEFAGFRDGSSVISGWIEHPHLARPGVIRFAGIIPGGLGSVTAPYGNIGDLLFTVRLDGDTTIAF